MRLATADELRRLLDRALAAWRVHHHPVVAEAVSSLREELLALRGDPLSVSTRPNQERGPNDFGVPAGLNRGLLRPWLEREGLGDPLDLARLCPTSTADGPGLRARVETLARRDDPDLAPLIVRLLHDGEHLDRDRWRFLLEQLSRTHERRPGVHGALLDSIRADEDRRRREAQAVIDALVAAPLAPLPRDVEALAAEALKAAGPQRLPEQEEAYVRRCVAQLALTPDDDAPRHVLTDYLLERGDLRGLFLRAQLTGQPVSPELQRRARSEWMDTTSERFGFERGFPHRLRLFARAPFAHLAVEQPWMPLVRELDVKALSSHDVNPAELALVDHPSARGLRAVSGVRGHLLERLTHTRRPWTTLQVLGGERLDRQALAAFPELRRLGFGPVDDVHPDALSATPHLEELELRAGNRPCLIALPASVRVLRLQGEVTVARGKKPLRLEVLHAETTDWPLPPGAHEIVELSLGHEVQPSASVLRRLTGLRRLAMPSHFSPPTWRWLATLTALERLELEGELVFARLLAARGRSEARVEPHVARGLAGLAALQRLHTLRLDAHPEDLGDLPPLQALRRLTLRCAEPWAPTSPAGLERLLASQPALEALALPYSEPSSLGAVLRVIAPVLTASTLREVTLDGNGLLERRDDGRWWHVGGPAGDQPL